jgi:hypothetical protein
MEGVAPPVGTTDFLLVKHNTPDENGPDKNFQESREIRGYPRVESTRVSLIRGLK